MNEKDNVPVKMTLFFCGCLSGGGEGGSWTSVWLWTPHVSLWKDTIWKQERAVFLPFKSNSHTHTHPLSHSSIQMFCAVYCWCCVRLSLFTLQVESFMEARLWNKIFVWTQQKVHYQSSILQITEGFTIYKAQKNPPKNSLGRTQWRGLGEGCRYHTIH